MKSLLVDHYINNSSDRNEFSDYQIGLFGELPIEILIEILIKVDPTLHYTPSPDDRVPGPVPGGKGSSNSDILLHS